MELNVKYITDKNGIKTDVQIPINQWKKLISDLNHFKQYSNLKIKLETAFEEISEMENDKTNVIPLQEFLNEC